MSEIVWWLAAGLGAATLGVVPELLARRWLRQRQSYYVWAPGYRRVAQIDLHAVPAAEPIARFEVNSVGERGSEPPQAQDVALHVLVAGGSAVECGLLDQETCWPNVLQDLLGREESRRTLGVSRVHVGNIGKSSVDSQALDRIFSRILPRYERLDVIIVLVGASNILRWLEEGAPETAPATDAPDAEYFDWHPSGPFGWHPKRTAVAELARRVRLRVFRPTQYRMQSGRFMTRARVARAQAKQTGGLCTALPDATVMLDAWESSLRSALVRAMLHSARVIVARQPWLDKPIYSAEEESRFWHGGFGDAYKQEVTKFCSSEALRDLMRQIDDRAAKVALELGVEQVDLRASLESNLINYYDQFHFTPTGAATVAAVLASVVLRGTASRKRPVASRSTARDAGDMPFLQPVDDVVRTPLPESDAPN